MHHCARLQLQWFWQLMDELPMVSLVRRKRCKGGSEMLIQSTTLIDLPRHVLRLASL
jgi:hypothetical protein